MACKYNATHWLKSLKLNTVLNLYKAIVHNNNLDCSNIKQIKANIKLIFMCDNPRGIEQGTEALILTAARNLQRLANVLSVRADSILMWAVRSLVEDEQKRRKSTRTA